MTTDDKDNTLALNDQELLALFKRAAHASRLRLVQNRAAITAEELALALGVSQPDLSAKVQAGRLFSVEVAGQLYYPAFYAAQDMDKTQFERVTKELMGLTGWEQWQFFTTPKGSLSDRTPLQALKVKGMFRMVVQTASGFAERFGSSACVSQSKPDNHSE